MDTELIGRDAERRVIDALLDEVRAGGSRALILSGEAGIGKSMLLAYATQQASGLRLLATRGYESESAIAFAGLADLLTPLAELLDALPQPQRVALAGTLALGPATSASPFAVYAATLGILTLAAEREPLLLVIDDAHWLDPSSAAAIRFTARRLRAEGIGLLLAARPSSGDGTTDAGIDRHPVGGLDQQAAEQIVRAVGGAQLSDSHVAQLVAVANGNPLALHEMPTLLDDTALAPGAPLPVGVTVERSFHRRIEQLPPLTQTALVVAAADRTGLLAPISLALDDVGVGASALAAAERAEMIVPDGTRLSFRHPLLRSTVYHLSPLADRCAAHAALARAYASLPGLRTDDDHAWHLSAATLVPDDDAATALDEVGRRARRRGASVEAARALERAAQLSEHLEARARRLVHAAKSWQLAGRMRHAATLLASAAELTTDPVARAEIHHLRGYVRMWQEAPAGVSAHLAREAAAVERVDVDRAALMLADAAVPAFMVGRIEDAHTLAQRAAANGERGGLAAQHVAELTLAVATLLRGDRAGARRLLDRCDAWLASEHALRRPQELIFAALVAMWLDDLPGARARVDRLANEARRHGALGVLPYALGLTSAIDLRDGRWRAGIANATESVQLAAETHQANAYGVFFLGHLHAAMGDVDAATTGLDEADALARRYGIAGLDPHVAAARGLLALGHAKIDEAIDHLARSARLADAQGVVDAAVVLSAGDHAEALVRAGRGDEAADVTRTRLSSAVADGAPWAVAVSARIDGLLDAGSRAMDHFERSLDALGDAWPFERARTMLCYGEVLRRNRRRTDARTRFRAALEIFEHLQAQPWIRHTRAELRATGERLRATHRAAFELTPQELQVAMVVARGATNQEAAAALFLSAKTIEYHLSKIYRKAGLTSRSELGRLVDAQPG